jgi:hypothetical protein
MKARLALKLGCVALPLLLLVLGVIGSGETSAPSGSPPRGSVTHVVVCYLKTPGDAAARKQLIEASRAFKSIPGVVSVSAGPVLPTTRPHADSSFDVGIAITFADADAMQAYVKDPIHAKAVKDLLIPLAKDWKSYDFTNE